MLNLNARKFPLHYEKVREFYIEGATEAVISKRLHICLEDVKDWTDDLREELHRPLVVNPHVSHPGRRRTK